MYRLSLLFTILHLLINICSTHKTCDQQILKHNPGIYFEEWKNMKTILSYWDFTLKINLKSIWHDSKDILKQVSYIEEGCTGAQAECAYLLSRTEFLLQYAHYADTQVQEIQDLLNFAQTNIHHKNTYEPLAITKSLREPFPFTGDELTLPADIKIPITSGIQNRSRTNAPVLHLKNSKIDETTHTLSELHNKSTQAYINVQSQTNIEQIRSPIPYLKFATAINKWIGNTEVYLIKLTQTYQTLKEIITYSLNNRFHPQLLSYQQTEAVARHIRQQMLGATLCLSESLIRTAISKSDSDILLTLSAPILGQQGHTLYKIYPIQVPITETLTASIHSNYEYIAYRPHEHILLMKDEIEACTVTEDLIICPPIRAALQQSTCEYDMLNDPTMQSLMHCSISLQNSTRNIQWTYLSHSDAWLYSSPTESKLTIACPGIQPENIKIQGFGTVQPYPGCKIYTPSSTLTSGFRSQDTISLYNSQVSLDATILTNSAIHITNLPPHSENILPDKNLAIYLSLFACILVIILILIILIAPCCCRPPKPHATTGASSTATQTKKVRRVHFRSTNPIGSSIKFEDSTIQRLALINNSIQTGHYLTPRRVPIPPQKSKSQLNNRNSTITAYDDKGHPPTLLHPTEPGLTSQSFDTVVVENHEEATQVASTTLSSIILESPDIHQASTSNTHHAVVYQNIPSRPLPTVYESPEREFSHENHTTHTTITMDDYDDVYKDPHPVGLYENF